MLLVNSLSPPPQIAEEADRCTRYCHNHGCPHFADGVQNGEISPRLFNLYATNIAWLKNNPLGISYAQMNILLYVILIPLLNLFLLWGLIRKRHG